MSYTEQVDDCFFRYYDVITHLQQTLINIRDGKGFITLRSAISLLDIKQVQKYQNQIEDELITWIGLGIKSDKTFNKKFGKVKVTGAKIKFLPQQLVIDCYLSVQG